MSSKVMETSKHPLSLIYDSTKRSKEREQRPKIVNSHAACTFMHASLMYCE